MPYYPGLRNLSDKNQIIDNILALKTDLNIAIPDKNLDGNLLIATWNLRDFGRLPDPERDLNPEPRLDESFYYIAEILNRFDLIAVQEVNRNMADFERLMRILGSSYDYIATDVTEGRGGNDERMVFIYDVRKVKFRNIAGEIVLPYDEQSSVKQFSRTPFCVSFQSDWLKFDICTTHLLYGADKDRDQAKYLRRVEEIRVFANYMFKRAEANKTNTFILGDFNIVGENDDTWKAFTESKFTIPESLKKTGSNINQSKLYDQIAFHAIDPIHITKDNDGNEVTGKFNFFQSVFKDTPEEKDRLAQKSNVPRQVKSKYREWSTWQMSDHLPVWICIQTDFSAMYLNALKNIAPTG